MSTTTAAGSGKKKPAGPRLVPPGPSLETSQPSAAAQKPPSAASSRAFMVICTSRVAIRTSVTDHEHRGRFTGFVDWGDASLADPTPRPGARHWTAPPYARL